jgi:copper chaperone CopZ
MKKVLKIRGLDCANCAVNLENAIQKIDGINTASVSFMTERLVIEFDENNEKEIMKKVKKQIKREEPDVDIEEL